MKTTYHSLGDGGRINPQHAQVRGVLRVVGPIVLAVGALCLIVGIAEFFMSAMGHGTRPKLFWLNFIGMPLLFFGSVMTMAAFAGAVARYQAAEIAPVTKDSFNYLADGTQDGVRTLGRAIGKGLSGGLVGKMIRCPNCDAENQAGSRFCDQCGTAIIRPCPDCGTSNDPDARFCDNCGQTLGKSTPEPE